LKLAEAWNEVIGWIKAYIRECRKEGKKPDYNLIRKFAKVEVRRVYQQS